MNGKTMKRQIGPKTTIKLLSPAIVVVLALLVVPISANEQELEQPSPEWKTQYGVRVATTRPGDCSIKVKNGDIVYIRHKGIYSGPQGKMITFDGDGGQPLRFRVGERRIITGMEVGVIGQCVGETRWVEIPPRLAYDDPTKFGHGRAWTAERPKPVPDGTTVLYEIAMQEAQRPGTLAYELANMQGALVGLTPWGLGLAAVVGLSYYFSRRGRRNAGGGKKAAAAAAGNTKKSR